MIAARMTIALAIACLASAPAAAGEVFGGVLVHDVDTPLTKSGIEGGLDVQLGWRGGRIARTPLRHATGQLVSSPETPSKAPETRLLSTTKPAWLTPEHCHSGRNRGNLPGPVSARAMRGPLPC